VSTIHTNDKYTRTAAFIDTARLVKNIAVLKGITNGKTKLLAVLKANAYGHGAVQSALICQQQGVDYIGVACANEGAILRNSGVTLPVVIFGTSFGADIEMAIQCGLILTVSGMSCAQEIEQAAGKLGLTAEVHIMVETGMVRLGFAPNDGGIAEIKQIASMPNIRISGIYSHLATSDWEDKTFAYEQLEMFGKFCEKLKDGGLDIPLRHISNSGGVIEGVERFGMSVVRIGIALYGLPPSSTKQGAGRMAEMGLKPVMTVKSKVAWVTEIEAGQSVGYSRAYFADKKTKIAVICAGYADGYSRLLSNNARVLINGEYAPVTGNICMDQFMVDVTHIENVAPGDDAVLMGEQNGKTISAEELAERSGTINFEVVTRISERVPRIFI